MPEEKVKQTRWKRKLRVFIWRLVLPGFQGMPFVRVMKLFGESLVKGILFQRAAAMTYRVFVAAIPMTMALFSLLSFVGAGLQQHVLNAVHFVVPKYAWPVAEKMMQEVLERQSKTMLWVFLAIGLYFSVLAINSFINSLRSSYFQVPMRNLFKQLFLSLQVFFFFVFSLCVIIGIFIFTSMMIKNIDEHTVRSVVVYTQTITAIRWVLVFVFVYFLISILHYIVPADKKDYRLFSAGSTLSTLLILLLITVIDFYFTDFADYNFIFGSMGAIFAVLLWFYLNAVVILAGFDLNVSIAKAKQDIKKKYIKNDHKRGN